MQYDHKNCKDEPVGIKPEIISFFLIFHNIRIYHTCWQKTITNLFRNFSFKSQEFFAFLSSFMVSDGCKGRLIVMPNFFRHLPKECAHPLRNRRWLTSSGGQAKGAEYATRSAQRRCRCRLGSCRASLHNTRKYQPA